MEFFLWITFFYKHVFVTVDRRMIGIHKLRSDVSFSKSTWIILYRRSKFFRNTFVWWNLQWFIVRIGIIEIYQDKKMNTFSFVLHTTCITISLYWSVENANICHAWMISITKSCFFSYLDLDLCINYFSFFFSVFFHLSGSMDKNIYWLNQINTWLKKNVISESVIKYYLTAD